MRVVLKKDLKIDNMLYHKHTEFYLLVINWDDKNRDSFNYTMKYKDKVLTANSNLFNVDFTDVKRS